MRAGRAVLNKLNKTYQKKFKDFVETIENHGYKLSAFKKVRRSMTAKGVPIFVYQTYLSDEDILEFFVTTDKKLYLVNYNSRRIIEPHDIAEADFKKEAEETINLHKLEEQRLLRVNHKLENKVSNLHKEAEEKLQAQIEDLQKQKETLLQEIEELKNKLGE